MSNKKIEQTRKEFIELEETFKACAYAQKNWTEEKFINVYGAEKDVCLQNAITYIRHKLYELDDGKNFKDTKGVENAIEKI